MIRLGLLAAALGLLVAAIALAVRAACWQ